MTNQEMIQEMIDRLEAQIETMASTINCIEVLDRDADFDLHDQIATADGLMEGLNALKDRMRAING
jgi:hypothetical protein